MHAVPPPRFAVSARISANAYSVRAFFLRSRPGACLAILRALLGSPRVSSREQSSLSRLQAAGAEEAQQQPAVAAGAGAAVAQAGLRAPAPEADCGRDPAR